MSDTATQAGTTREVDGRELPQPGTYAIDNAHSMVEFVARHLMVTKVRGRFNDFSGTIEIAERPEDSSVQVSIRADSLDSGDPKRDEHLRTADFLEVDRYPTLEFVSTKVEPAGRSWKVTGDLSVHGQTHPVVLDVEFDGAFGDPWGGERIGFTATTEVDREGWGLTWNQALETGGFLVGKKVRIELSIAAVRK